MEVQVMQDILGKNDRLAAENQRANQWNGGKGKDG